MFIKILENLYKMLYKKKYCKIKNTICLFFSKTFISKRFLFLKNPNEKQFKRKEVKKIYIRYKRRKFYGTRKK